MQGRPAGAKKKPRAHDRHRRQRHARHDHGLFVETAHEQGDGKRAGQRGDPLGRAVKAGPRRPGAFVPAEEVENIGISRQHADEGHAGNDKEHHQAKGAERAVLHGQLARVQQVELRLIVHLESFAGEQRRGESGKEHDDREGPSHVADAEHLDFDAVVGRHLRHGLEEKTIPCRFPGLDVAADELPRAQTDFVEPRNAEACGRGKDHPVFLHIGPLVVIRSQFQPQRIVGHGKNRIHQIEERPRRDGKGEERGAPPIRRSHVGEPETKRREECTRKDKRTAPSEAVAAVVRDIAHHRIGKRVDQPRDGGRPPDEDGTHPKADVVNRDEQTVQPIGRHLVAEPAHAPGDLLPHRQTSGAA